MVVAMGPEGGMLPMSESAKVLAHEGHETWIAYKDSWSQLSCCEIFMIYPMELKNDMNGEGQDVPVPVT
jgi:hypothetical protein